MELQKEYIKSLNPGKILNFSKNTKTNTIESEILFENVTDQKIITKVYINSKLNFKCSPSIIITPPKSENKIKVFLTNSEHNISISDILLLITHPINDNVNEADNIKLNEFFKNNKNLKESGQKLFLYAFTEDQNTNNENEEDKSELIEKIKELENKLYKPPENMKKEEKLNQEKENIENPKKNNNYNNTYIYIGLGILALVGSIILYKVIKKK